VIPREVYVGREGLCRAQARRLERGDRWLSGARLVTALVALGLGIAVVRGAARYPALAAPVLVFAGLVLAHERVVRRRERQDTLAALYRAGIARIDDQWAGQGDAGARFARAAAAGGHLYAADLDLYGEGGLFELLNVAHTPIGQRTLARWLEGPASAAEARARQAAVAELAPRLDLREELTLAGRAVRTAVREEALSSWALAAVPGLPRRLGPTRLALAALAVATALAALGWACGRSTAGPAAAGAALLWLMARRWRASVAAVTGGIDQRADELQLLVRAIVCLEREAFEAPLLRDLRRALGDGPGAAGSAPSVRVARLRRLVGWLEARRNQFMALLLAPLQWSAQLAFAIEDWRRANGAEVACWMDAVGTLDALMALAVFSYEHPDYPFPEILDGASAPFLAAAPGPDDAVASEAGPVFEARGLGHPLLPSRQRVVNDVALGGALRLYIVSGSNMSGKSTLLRAVGVNVALALAGAPVCARRLRLSPVQLGATLRVNDSLQEGKSRFYAELTRLKQIVDHAGAEPPLLFLLDEILHGTNSHDRRIGAEAILRGLVARGAAGFVTTHDLALTEVADALGPRAANVHFDDHLEDGVMTFDYTMKPGIVQKSNALALMRAVGLDFDR
jgi:hypothetical protein